MLGRNIFPVTDHDEVLVALVVDVMGEIVVCRSVRQVEAGDDIPHRPQCCRALILAAELHAEIAHHDLVQCVVCAPDPHGKRWRIGIRDPPGQSARALKVFADCRFHECSL